jgi:hypothetical protein
MNEKDFHAAADKALGDIHTDGIRSLGADIKTAAETGLTSVAQEARATLLPLALKAWAGITLLLLAWSIIALLLLVGANKRGAQAIATRDALIKSNAMVTAQIVYRDRERVVLVERVVTNTVLMQIAESNYALVTNRYSGVSNWHDAIRIYNAHTNN